ncbi:MAG: MTH1187 family thiamine-binding protein [Peptoniphilaceae bacterium]|nr:MTH1187 family thiamine-binding protein [Peptoniphilaceae bacterium]MDY6018218.1 MTH1187 family thiamine-binding protein [Anaerococcus sp.]
MAIAEVCIIPIGVETSVSKYVAACQKVLEKEENIKYSLNPMGTNIEASPEEIFIVIRKMQEAVFEKNVDRIYTVIKMDERHDKKSSMEQKIQSVKEKL